MRQLLFLVSLLSIPVWLGGQTQLLYTDFNECFLDGGWTVNISGNQNAEWYVGTLQNSDGFGESIDGSCCLIVDDDATGDQTPAFVWNAISPAFDASQHSTVKLEMDIHYRDWGPSAEFLEVLITDGVTEHVLSHFEGATSTTGDSLHEHKVFVADLSLLSNSDHLQIILRYDDAGGFGWWAAFDNIQVTGIGNGVNVIREAFNSCEKPADWSTDIVAGVDDWKFGVITEGKALSSGNSMNGTCFVFFDDDFIGQDTPFSTVRLVSPWFDGTSFGRFELNFDLILRYQSEKIAVIVQHGDGSEHLVRESEGDVGGPFFGNYVPVTLDLSPFRAPQMRVIFQYDDGQSWAWWAGIDNVKVTGFGAANDICANAPQLLTGAPCTAANNLTALFDGPLPTCSGGAKSSTGLWFSWQPLFTGVGMVDVRSEFNDLVEVFSGSCADLQPVACNNRDEHGFGGEKTWFNVVSGSTYLIRVSNLEGVFGKARGAMCIQVQQASGYPTKPANDQCNNATNLTVNGPCVSGNNRNAENPTPLPSLNERARADVWYQFTAPALPPGEILEIRSNANFSDIITVYSGTCNSLQEVAGEHQGKSLQVAGLNPGQVYKVQIAGNFASVEGELCPQIVQKSMISPANDECVAATTLSINAACTAGNNEFASFSGIKPSCVVNVDRDVWYKFQAPTSGSVRIHSGAEFQHIVAVWKGACGNLEELLCADNPTRCEGYLHLGGLNPGVTYFIQVAAQIGLSGDNSGDFCIKIEDGAIPAAFEPLQMSVVEQCIGNDQAQLQVVVSDGVPPYVFEGSVSGDVLPEGQVYIVVVTDAMGCVRSTVDIVDDCFSGGCALSATLAAVQPDCHNAATGSLEAIVSGGAGPYTYLWSDGQTTAKAIGLQGGINYSVVITDAVGCGTDAAMTLTNPTEIVAVPTDIIHPTSGLNNGSIMVDVTGGTGPYAFLWRVNGIIVSTSQQMLNAPAGSYVLFINDAHGCNAVLNVILTETIGTQSIASDIFAEIFPNPAHDKATLGLSLPEARDLVLTLTDAAGRGLHTWTVHNVTETNVPIDIADLPAGQYQLRIMTGEQTIVRKFIKQ